MEAATAPRVLPAMLRARAFEQECARLRPLGEAYVGRRFGGSLNRADAEDVVSEVLIRLHRQVEKGRGPQNLRAAFFTSVRNASIDLLRARAARPTVALEAASAAEAGGKAPEEWAEGREDAARLQEALGRMRSNYREAILLRFGLGMTVPEMAKQLGISLPAAKKLVLRATRQVTQRVESIEGAEFCPEMRQMAKRALVEKEACGLAEEGESAVLQAHFAHCGACKSFLANLHGSLHDLGAAAVVGLAAGQRMGVRFGPLEHLGNWVSALGDTAQVGAERVREVAYRLNGAVPGTDVSSAGVLMGTGQKIAAVCTAGAATTATCLLTGAVGPGIGASPGAHEPPPKPAAQVRAAEPSPEAAPPELPLAPVGEAPAPAAEPSEKEGSAKPEPKPPQSSTPVSEAASGSPPPSEAESSSQAASEFGVESAASSAPAPKAAAAPPSAAPSAGGGDFGATSGGGSGSVSGGGGGGGGSGGSSSSGSGAGSNGAGTVGFQG